MVSSGSRKYNYYPRNDNWAPRVEKFRQINLSFVTTLISKDSKHQKPWGLLGSLNFQFVLNFEIQYSQVLLNNSGKIFDCEKLYIVQGVINYSLLKNMSHLRPMAKLRNNCKCRQLSYIYCKGFLMMIGES